MKLKSATIFAGIYHNHTTLFNSELASVLDTQAKQ